MIIHVCCLPERFLIISRILNWCEIIDFIFTWHNQYTTGMLSCCPFDACDSLGQSLNFCPTIMLIMVPFIAFHVTKSCFFSHCRYRSGTVHIMLAKQYFHVIVSNWLIITRKIQINIWHFISGEAHKSFKWNILSITNQHFTWMIGIFFFRQVITRLILFRIN